MVKGILSGTASGIGKKRKEKETTMKTLVMCVGRQQSSGRGNNYKDFKIYKKKKKKKKTTDKMIG